MGTTLAKLGCNELYCQDGQGGQCGPGGPCHLGDPGDSGDPGGPGGPGGQPSDMHSENIWFQGLKHQIIKES